MTEYYKHQQSNKVTVGSNYDSLHQFDSNLMSIVGLTDPTSIVPKSLISEDNHEGNLMLNEQPERRRSQQSEVEMAPKYCGKELNTGQDLLQQLVIENKIMSAQGQPKQHSRTNQFET